MTSFRNYIANLSRNLSDEEFKALQNLSKNTNLVIQKSDKGNSVVILDKDVYIKHMESLLSNKANLKKLILRKLTCQLSRIWREAHTFCKSYSESRTKLKISRIFHKKLTAFKSIHTRI